MQPLSFFSAPTYTIRHGAHRVFIARRPARLPRRLRRPRHAIRTAQPAPFSPSAPDPRRSLGSELLDCLRVVRRPRLAVDPQTQLLPDLEEGHALRVHGHERAGLRVAPLAGLALLHHEAAEAADLDPLAAHQRLGEAVEDLVDDHL